MSYLVKRLRGKFGDSLCHEAADEIEALRGLVQCTECSKELGTDDYRGWMAGICPGCQAEMYEGTPI